MSNWESTEGYVLAHGSEYSIGGDDELGIKIFIKTNRKINDNDKTALYKANDQLHEDFGKESLRLDPETRIKADAEKQKLIACFPHPVYVKEIPNEYCSRFCCAFKPWLLATTRKGVFKIGWRKSVIHLEWTDSDITAKADELFANDVTKYDKVIHCWGYEKAKEYIEKLLS